MPAPTLTVVPDPVKRRCLITVNGTDGEVISLYRLVMGEAAGVRGAVDVTMLAPSMLFADYELPQNVEFSYYAVGAGGTSVPVSAGIFDFGGDVMFDLSRPSVGQRVYVESFPEQTHDISADVVRVWDREDPVVVSGARQYPTGRVTLVSLSLSERSVLLETLRRGAIIALSPWQPTYGLPSPSYYYVGLVTEQRPSPLAHAPERRWLLDVQQVAPPRSTYVYPVGDVTWQGVKDNYADWSALLPLTWSEVSGF
ncbi:MAG: hypothetical protein RLZ55_146 [Actinomycetota bacterium]